MKEKNKNQGGKLKWSQKVQIKYVINLSVPNTPGACGPEGRGRGCCIEYPDEETQMVQAGECRAEDGFPLFAGEE